jgi:hypothetical protein
MTLSEGDNLEAFASFDTAMTTGKDLFSGARQQHSQIVAAERCFRRALALSPQNAEAMAYIGRTLEDQGRLTEAKDWYDRALIIDPACLLARERLAQAVQILGLDLPQERRKMLSRFPETIVEFADLEAAMKRYCLSPTDRPQLSVSKITRMVTFGSCFAANLANALNHDGIETHNLGMGEIFNSTYSNLELIEWLFGIRASAAETILQNFGDGRDEIAKWVKEADVIIYTLGVAPCYFEVATGSFILPGRIEGVRGAISGKYIFRTTSVDENYLNLCKLTSIIREYNPNCKFVFSLSPVPLAATLEKRSIMEADCLSKATLRLAVEQLIRDTQDCLYWPAFEMVRWLGAYIPRMYGEEDESPFHVSERVVRTIIRLFLQTYGTTEPHSIGSATAS